jgi:hypothetical protein
MPHKANAARRHHIARPKRRVTNGAEYDAALRQRGSLTVWFTDEAIESWKAAPRTTPGGQPHYSDLGDHGKEWEVGGGLRRHRRIGSRFDSGSLWDEHAY